MQAIEYRNNNLTVVNHAEEQKKKSQIPYLPFKMVNEMAKHYLVPFVQKTITVLENKPITVKDAETSCVYNLLALMVIFSGCKKAIPIKERLSTQIVKPFSIVLPDGAQWFYNVDNLFTGSIMADSSVKNITCSRSLYERRYVKYISPIVNKSFQIDVNNLSPYEADIKIINNLIRELRMLKFEFNRSVIDLLKKDLKQNGKKVNSQTSFIYYVVIVMPDYYAMYDSGEKHTTFYHAFAIEQFQGAEGVLHRLYHSWQNRMTILDFFKKQNYAGCDEGCLTLDQMDLYLTDINSILSPKTNPEDIPALRERRFGEPSFGVPLPLLFDDRNSALSGFSLRYHYSKISPSDSVRNFREFIKDHF